MFLTRQDAVYGAVALPLLFLTGISITYAAVDTNALTVATCLCCLTLLLAFGFCRLATSGPGASPHRLLLDAHGQVARLTGQGYDMLVPCEEHNETARLLICMEDGYAVIKKETWRGVWHHYVISPDGELKREIWGISGELTPADHEWLNGPLTPTRLKRLVTALTDSYSPRQRVTAMP